MPPILVARRGVNYEKSITRRFWQRADGDWDYFPEQTYDNGGRGYWVTGATRQLMIAADRQIKRRLSWALLFVISMLLVIGARVAANLGKEVSFVNSMAVLAAVTLLIIVSAVSVATILLNRRLNLLLHGAPVSTENYSMVRTEAERREDLLFHMRRPTVRVFLAVAAGIAAADAFHAYPDRVSDAIGSGLFAFGFCVFLAMGFVCGGKR